MRRTIITSGKCTYCSQTFPGSPMGRHLKSCKERETYLMSGIAGVPGRGSKSSNRPVGDKGKTSALVFLLKVSSRYMPEYWLFVDATASSCKLADIDSLLRRTWLECCGHLSHFIIGDEEYESSPDPEFRSKSMRVALDRVLGANMTFCYEYDYGSTTELVLKVVAVRPGKLKRGLPLMLVARNDPVSFECTSCKKAIATEVCSVCLCEGPKAMFCASCLKRHKCEDMALPILNSPRTGVCGYTG